MSSCSSCGKETPEEALNFGDNGKICDACQLEEDLAVARPGMGSAWLQLSGAWVLLFLSFCIYHRTTSRSTFSAAGETTETLTYGVDLPGLVLAGLVLPVMLSTLIAIFRASPKGSKSVYWVSRLACLAGLLLLIPFTAYSLYDALPGSSTTTTGPKENCALGDANACNTQGVRHDRNGEQVQALEYFNKACDLKHGMACYNVGIVNQQLPTPNYKASAVGYEKSCHLGYKDSCNEVLTAIHEREPPDRMAAFRDDLEPLCANDVGRSCSALGTLLLMGVGGEPQGMRAMLLLEAECEQNSALACMNLSAGYRDGAAGERNLTKAIEADRKACKLGAGNSCDRLERNGE